MFIPDPESIETQGQCLGDGIRQYTRVAFSNDMLTVLTRIAASSSFMLFDVASISFSRLSLLLCYQLILFLAVIVSGTYIVRE